MKSIEVVGGGGEQSRSEDTASDSVVSTLFIHSQRQRGPDS